MNDDKLVLDANVLIGFYNAGWFDSLKFWHPEYELLVPEAIWRLEFTPNREIDASPDWLSVVRVSKRINPDNPGQLSQNDWRGLILARDQGGILITSDKRLKERAEEDEITTKWSGGFLLDTFQSCGIDVEDYQSGIGDFIADSYLSKRVCDELQAAEKP